MIKLYYNFYPELVRKEEEIITVLQKEIEKFEKALVKGLAEFEKIAQKGTISGIDAFMLYESYGFPLELTQEMAQEKNIKVNEEEFYQEQKKHQEASRAGAEKKFGGHGLVLETGEIHASTEEDVRKVTRLHTASHLLQAALRKILGKTVEQRGSDITTDRLRFDFTFERKVSAEELKKVEELINDVITQGYEMKKEEMSFAEAKKSGALAFFRGKYPERVTVYSATKNGEIFSREVCGGPHVTNTQEIGKFKIIKEEASSAGVRRVRATVEEPLSFVTARER